MSGRFANFKKELGPMLRLAGPLALAELGWMTMGLVDTMMVGRLPNSAAAIGGVGLGSVIFYTVGVFGPGLLMGLDTLVSQSFGAGRMEDCRRSLVNALWICLPVAPAVMALIFAVMPFIGAFGVHPAVLHETLPYLRAMTWSTLPLMLYSAFRRYLQALNLIAPVTFALVSANLVNVAVNWVLIFGNLGAPALGAEGAGWATTISRAYMALFLLGYTVYHELRQGGALRRVSWSIDPQRVRRLLGLGFPVALQHLLEVGIFALVTALISRIDPVSLAAHHVAMMAASITFMVPLGVSSAAAVRVGQALGRGDGAAAERAGWTGLLLGAAFMSLAAAAFILAPEAIGRVFTPDETVISGGVALLFIAAFFQFFDGVQIVATGALRGAGDTRTPLACHLVAYWIVGLPLGYYLCFSQGWGAPGLWVGLCVALISIGLVLLMVWRRKAHTFCAVAKASAQAGMPVLPAG